MQDTQEINRSDTIQQLEEENTHRDRWSVWSQPGESQQYILVLIVISDQKWF